jgi:hypothetical protein
MKAALGRPFSLWDQDEGPKGPVLFPAGHRAGNLLETFIVFVVAGAEDA